MSINPEPVQTCVLWEAHPTNFQDTCRLKTDLMHQLFTATVKSQKDPSAVKVRHICSCFKSCHQSKSQSLAIPHIVLSEAELGSGYTSAHGHSRGCCQSQERLSTTHHPQRCQQTYTYTMLTTTVMHHHDDQDKSCPVYENSPSQHKRMQRAVARLH
jgi:hypothetical protein